LSLNRDDLTSESSKLYNSYALHYNKLYPGTQELIERCKSNNIKIGVCTNSQRKRTIQSLSSFGMEWDFEHIVTREDVSEGKPSSESYTLLAEKLESELDDTCVILENTPTWLAAAIQTWATVVQVDHASNQPKIKEATHYITDWSQLIHIFS
jgi:HAD superfamily hydrolase (TIGR01509 family)